MNPTGSTTFGQDFTDAISENWGGRPFEDMQKGWKHVLKTYPEIDPDRAVAAGASWGGYAINWIQGHPEFGFGFKALVCHDGVFSAMYSGYATDELFFEWGGRPWESKAKAVLEKYDPTNFVHKWSTPMLVIHGSKDYRLPETDGIGAFHALQERGIPSRLVIFPDENHWVMNHQNRMCDLKFKSVRCIPETRLLSPLDPTQDTFNIPTQYIFPVEPSRPGQKALILHGDHKGEIAIVREEEENGWFVSVGNMHFEVSADKLVQVMDV
ncbi:predicted protein [Postia placenta Mad-698-R]|nr:predicted protein [Postia placenta Mad-698-R]